jgi:hypothetical protein
VSGQLVVSGGGECPREASIAGVHAGQSFRLRDKDDAAHPFRPRQLTLGQPRAKESKAEEILPVEENAYK